MSLLSLGKKTIWLAKQVSTSPFERGESSDRERFSNGTKQNAEEYDAGDHTEHDDDDLCDGLRRDVTVAYRQHRDQHEVCATKPPAQPITRSHHVMIS